LGAFSAEEVRELLNIPEEYQIVAVSPFGYPAEDGRQRSRKPREELICRDQWK
jgi:nitroreductase